MNTVTLTYHDPWWHLTIISASGHITIALGTDELLDVGLAAGAAVTRGFGTAALTNGDFDVTAGQTGATVHISYDLAHPGLADLHTLIAAAVEKGTP